MQNPFTSPFATRKLSIAIAWVVATLAFGVMWMWPYDNPEGPDVPAEICVLIVFGSIFLWAASDSWKAWLQDFEYGVRLKKLDQATETVDKAPTVADAQPLQSLTDSLQLVGHPAKEKLRFPWPALISCICCILLFIPIFMVNGVVSVTWLLGVVCASVFVYRPIVRWFMCYSDTKTYEAKEAEEKSFLPLDKHFIHVDDSNFYRFQKRKLLELGFQPLGQQRFHHFFTNPTGDLIAILGRKHSRQGKVYNYFSLISIDDQGCVFQSDSFIAKNFKKLADCHKLWKCQTLDTQDIETALTQHNEYAVSGDATRRFVSAGDYSVLAKYIDEVTTIAKVKHFNQHRIAIA